MIITIFLRRKERQMGTDFGTDYPELPNPCISKVGTQ